MFDKEKKYFKIKSEAVQRMIWDLEFKRFKVSVARERTRHTLDGANAKLQIIETKISSLPPDQSSWTDEQKRILDEKTLLVQDIDGLRNGDGSVARMGYKDMLKDMDLEIHGSGKTQEFPDGVNGIAQQIEALRDLQSVLRQYLKQL